MLLRWDQNQPFRLSTQDHNSFSPAPPSSSRTLLSILHLDEPGPELALWSGTPIQASHGPPALWWGLNWWLGSVRCNKGSQKTILRPHPLSGSLPKKWVVISTSWKMDAYIPERPFLKIRRGSDGPSCCGRGIIISTTVSLGYWYFLRKVPCCNKTFCVYFRRKGRQGGSFETHFSWKVTMLKTAVWSWLIQQSRNITGHLWLRVQGLFSGGNILIWKKQDEPLASLMRYALSGERAEPLWLWLSGIT